MPRHTLILHGWSDCSDSFKGLKAFLKAHDVGDVSTIYYADYESREDSITFEDVVGGLNDELREKGLIDRRGRGNLNVIVHSTGGLVIRHWIWRYYADRISECPVKNLVMLAPANFGSPLAHRGKSFLGRLFKGRWRIGDMLEVGRQLLNGLELASAYQWTLAERDLLGPVSFYDTDRIRLTVLVGLDDYKGLRGWVNKPGTDGTVVISGTPLNARKLRLDFADPEVPVRWDAEAQIGRFAFGTLKGYDHGSIVGAFSRGAATRLDGEPVAQHVVTALKTRTARQFGRHCDRLDQETSVAYDPAGYADPEEAPRRYQQFLLHAIDDQDEPIRDFTVEFFVRRANRSRDGKTLTNHGTTKAERALTDKVSKLLTSQFHTYSGNSSHRRFLVDGDKIRELIPNDCLLAMRVYVPRVDKGIYYDNRNLQDVVLYDPTRQDDTGPVFFYPNTTTLVELAVDRVTEYVTVRTTARKH